MNITGYILPRTLKLGLSVLMWIVHDQYQCSSGYWDSSTYLGQEMCILSHAQWALELKEVVTGYTLPRTLKLGLSVLIWIVYD